jgi:predicted nuclease of predicted toxin-antitoxin system
MKFKLDENFGTRTQQLLQAAGHDVHSILQEGLQGADDETIYSICCVEQRYLVTLDLDFSDVVRYPPEHAGGIIVIRVPRNPSLVLLERLLTALLLYLEQNIAIGQLLIVEPGRIRLHQRDHS